MVSSENLEMQYCKKEKRLTKEQRKQIQPAIWDGRESQSVFYETYPPQLPSSIPKRSEQKRQDRPRRLFEESSQRSKQRHVKPIVSDLSSEKLFLAAKSTSLKSGKRTAAQVVKLAIQSTPRRLEKIKLLQEASFSCTIRPYSPVEALGRGANIYPLYHVIAKTKRKKCYPANIKITENQVVVPLLDLLIHITQRLAQVQANVILQNISDCDTIVVYYKWGLDGSGRHNVPKQNFANNSQHADFNIILCTIVPPQMCESNDSKEIKFKHIPICTMLDGKTVNILTDTSSSRACNVCKATPKGLNDLEKHKNGVWDEATFKYGISVLHAHLRCYEYLLHIACKLELQQWQARGRNAKEKVKTTKVK
ncbi:hypothetical protein ILUMI_03603 [Ignelater luminosus]|uniref:Uncharacterized protein n=1 Tax=Ignelater luminosus TaxID=2038154 RepID=A0A8K0DG14_IGNLU|nr:hypothetical protein ILUMI_03603 [Ignelater luminosus]